MKAIINEVAEKLKHEFITFFSEEEKGLVEAERYFSRRIADATLELLRVYYEEMDRRLLEDKARRKQLGLTVERRNAEREILTSFGCLEYKRTYYKKASGGYEFPTDQVIGIGSYERVSEHVGLSLVDASCEMSYAKASQYVTGSQVSKQTVMNKIRQACPQHELVEYRKLTELHIDADEDHVNLQSGDNAIVPLVSIYEGIEHQGKRGICKNIFHISEYGKSPDEFWEEVSEELYRRYDLRDAKVYLHGDGANWIRTGMDYLPNCRFVLDRYHKNAAIKQALSGIDQNTGKEYESRIRKALDEDAPDQLLSVRDEILSKYPYRKGTVKENIEYLLNNFDAITITNHDEASLNGGCTEPHVSHVLSSRLSSRPMGWSRTTLKRFVPILANGSATFTAIEEPEYECLSAAEAYKYIRKRYLPNTLGLADPDNSVSFPARAYKVTGLFNALKPF